MYTPFFFLYLGLNAKWTGGLECHRGALTSGGCGKSEQTPSQAGCSAKEGAPGLWLERAPLAELRKLGGRTVSGLEGDLGSAQDNTRPHHCFLGTSVRKFGQFRNHLGQYYPQPRTSPHHGNILCRAVWCS